ncbi:MAG: polysaccharide biosynthesis C-terminal domain-containing protein [Stenotrophomonas sp.]|uniref:oligosaccharide flippase family protein n=1 Tax=Stenotrophomonas sp. TaxID=69392 RepID=UPI003D6D329B
MNHSIKNISVVCLFVIGGAGLAFLTQVLTARVLGPHEYGIFVAAFTAINIISPLAGFGLQGFWLKVFGCEGWQAMRWIRPTFLFCVTSTLTTMLGVAIWAVISMGIEDPVAGCILILSITLLSTASAEIVATRFLLEERAVPLMSWQIMPQVMRFLLVVWVLMTARLSDAMTFAWMYAVVGGVLAIAGIPHIVSVASGGMNIVGHRNTATGVAVTPPTVSEVASGAWAFGLGNFFFLIYFQSAIIFVSHYLGPEATAGLGVAVSLLAALYLLPTAIYQKLLMPRFHRWAYQSPDALRAAYRDGNRYMLGLGIVAAIAVAVSAPYLVPLLFGSEYSMAAKILAWLAPCIPMRLVSTSAGAILSTGDRMRSKIRIMAIVAGVNLLLNYLLIGIAGINGAILAAVVTEALLVGLYIRAANRFLCHGFQA